MKNQEISALIGQKRAYNSSSFLLYFSKKTENGQNNPKNGAGTTKKTRNIAILASKKNFKTAVLRNKARRKVRNAVYKIQKKSFNKSLNSYSLIFSLKKGFEKVVFNDLVEEIKQSLSKNAIIEA